MGLRQALARCTLPHPLAPMHQYTCRTEHVHIFMYPSSLVNTERCPVFHGTNWFCEYIKYTMFSNDFNYMSSETIYWGGGSLFPSNLQNWMTVFASHTPGSILSNTLKWLSFLFCSFETSIVTFIYFSLLGHAYMRTCAFFKFALYIHMHVILWVCALWCTSVCFIMFCMNLWLLMFLIIILYYYWFVCVYLCVSGFSSSCKELWVPKSTQYIPYYY